jgi:hypothetical protein
MRLLTFAAFGTLSGVAAGLSCAFLRLGDAGTIEIVGYCFGVKPTSTSACQAIDGAFYLFPGLLFGVVFGPLLLWRGELHATGAIAYAAAATIANAAAVLLCVSLTHPLDDLLPFDNPIVELALSGIAAGAAGAMLLGAALRLLKPEIPQTATIAIAAGLGVVTPAVIMFERIGVFGFYIIWQTGYAVALGMSLGRRTRADLRPPSGAIFPTA